MSYLDAYYDDFKNATCSQWHALNTTQCMGPVRDLSDESLPFAPDFAGTLSLEYTVPVASRYELLANIDVIYSDSFFSASDLDPITEQSSYTRYDLRLALAPLDSRWEVALVGKNLSDEFISGWRNDITLSTTPGRQNTYFGLAEPPRTIALQARVSFW
jgi:outer membrane receptor protein involved in Fe transport